MTAARSLATATARAPWPMWTGPLAELASNLRYGAHAALGEWVAYTLPGGAQVSCRMHESTMQFCFSRREPAAHTITARRKWAQEVEVFQSQCDCDDWDPTHVGDFHGVYYSIFTQPRRGRRRA